MSPRACSPNHSRLCEHAFCSQSTSAINASTEFRPTRPGDDKHVWCLVFPAGRLPSDVAGTGNQGGQCGGASHTKELPVLSSCPVVSQVSSLSYAIRGQPDKARTIPRGGFSHVPGGVPGSQCFGGQGPRGRCHPECLHRLSPPQCSDDGGPEATSSTNSFWVRKVDNEV